MPNKIITASIIDKFLFVTVSIIKIHYTYSYYNNTERLLRLLQILMQQMNRNAECAITVIQPKIEVEEISVMPLVNKYQEFREKTFGPFRMPIQVQIGHIIFTLKPQLSCYPMEHLLILIRRAYSEIPKNTPIYIVNFTKGWRTGRLVGMEETLDDMMIDSNARFPSVRIYWNNGIKYKVKVDVHDIMELSYTLDMFDELHELVRNIKEELLKKFSVCSNYEFALQLMGNLEDAKMSAYVGSFFVQKKLNTVKALVNFKQKYPIKLAKELYPESYEQLICPITQTIMQESALTPCNHLFDKFALSFQIISHKKCPLCRSPIKSFRSILTSKKHKIMIKKLKDVYYERLLALKKQEQEQSESAGDKNIGGNEKKVSIGKVQQVQ